MLTKYRRALFVVLWLFFVLATWALFVPMHVSIANWMWLYVGAGSIAFSVNRLVDRHTQAPTVAQVLYDVEHEPVV